MYKTGFEYGLPLNRSLDGIVRTSLPAEQLNPFKTAITEQL